MEKKQNSVEWLAQEIDNMISFIDIETSISFKRIVEQAKAMHQKEIEHAYRCGAAEIGMIAVNKPKQYYNETFGGDNE